MLGQLLWCSKASWERGQIGTADEDKSQGKEKAKRGRGLTNLSKVLLHNLWAVVDGEDNIRDASRGQGFDLMQDHALVAKLDQGLGERQGLGC